MDDYSSIYQARKTTIEMLEDRGYIVPESVKCDTFNDFKQQVYNKKCDILVTEPTKCYVKFVLISRVRPNTLREYITQIREKIVGEEDELILVIKNKPNTTLTRISKEFKGVQIFWIRNLLANITKHRFNPKFELVPDEEIIELLRKLQVKSKMHLPQMLKDDPISLYYGYKIGSIIKIIRISETSGKSVSWRVVK